MNIFAISDLFVTAELIEQVLRSHLSDLSAELRFTHLHIDWPRTPFQSAEEVSEFVGDERQIYELAADADVIVTHVGPITEKVIRNAPHLKAIAVPRGGPLNVNVKAATEHHIAVINAPGRNAPVVAEFTMGIILAELRNIARAHKDLSNGVWRGDFYEYSKAGFELSNSTVGVVGFGSIGARVAELLKAFGCRVVVHDPYVEDDAINSFGYQAVNLETLLGESDIVTLQLRLTQDTHHIAGEEFFARMKSGAFFVNAARGGLVDYSALANALDSGQIGRAALDVFDREPPPSESPLYRRENVTLTPHIGGASQETAERGLNIVAADVRRLLEGQRLHNCLNLEHKQ